MTNFWNLEQFKENIAIYTENEEISYSNLLDRVNDVESTLKKSPQSLVFSKCKNENLYMTFYTLNIYNVYSLNN